ncbi:MAG: hypothetical protein COT74_01160 [Bdellovibrionales bacterium CG10_big_fil_rev_8_21_14_0_10_45_34]|nr:MAG: hypothetical protein COT74_01160 [Bdellovibrionales bacterium CG10_big_fil_rev_8_21_14_0_10_45_34]
MKVSKYVTLLFFGALKCQTAFSNPSIYGSYHLGRNFSYDESVAWTGENSQSFSMEKLLSSYSDRRVFYFGEIHSDPTAREFLTRNLAIFKNHGFSTLVLESLSSSLQDDVNKYLYSNGTLEPISQYLKFHWGWSPVQYLDLIKEAKRLGIRIVAADTTASPSAFRDRHMAQKIVEAIEEDVNKGKIAFLVGANHIASKFHLSEFQADILLYTHSVKVLRIEMIGEEFKLHLQKDLLEGLLSSEIKEGPIQVEFPKSTFCDLLVFDRPLK